MGLGGDAPGWLTGPDRQWRWGLSLGCGLCVSLPGSLVRLQRGRSWGPGHQPWCMGGLAKALTAL